MLLLTSSFCKFRNQNALWNWSFRGYHVIFSSAMQVQGLCQTTTAAPYRPVTGVLPPCPSPSRRKVTKPAEKRPTATWRTTTRTRTSARTHARSKMPQLNSAPAEKRKPGPCLAARRSSSSSPPSTSNATWAAQSGPAWPPPSTWRRHRWRSGSRTGGTSGRGSWRRTWRPLTSRTRTSGSSGCPFCTTTGPRPQLPWASIWPDTRCLHPWLASPAPSATLCPRSPTLWACWGRRWPAWFKDDSDADQ